MVVVMAVMIGGGMRLSDDTIKCDNLDVCKVGWFECNEVTGFRGCWPAQEHDVIMCITVFLRAVSYGARGLTVLHVYIGQTVNVHTAMRSTAVYATVFLSVQAYQHILCT